MTTFSDPITGFVVVRSVPAKRGASRTTHAADATRFLPSPSAKPLPKDDGFRWRLSAHASEQPAQGLKAEQQAPRHLVGSRGGDHVLVHCQDVAQAAIEWTLLIDHRTAR